MGDSKPPSPSLQGETRVQKAWKNFLQLLPSPLGSSPSAEAEQARGGNAGFTRECGLQLQRGPRRVC